MMVLPSQTARSTTHRSLSSMHRQRRMRRGPLVAGAVLLAGLAVAAYFWLSPTSDPELSALPPSTVLAREEAEAPPVRPALTPGLTPVKNGSSAPAEPLDAAPPSPRIIMGDRETRLGGGPLPTPAVAPLSSSKESKGADAHTAAEDALQRQSDGSGAKAPVGFNPPESPGSVPPGASASSEQVQRGQALLAQGKLVEAREALSTAVLGRSLIAADDRTARQLLQQINTRLAFGPEIALNDPFAGSYVIQSGDRLATIVRDQKLAIDWRFLARINRIARPESVQAGQKIKIIRGPFHAVVDKQAFRLDLLLGESEARVLIASYPVGLGEHDSTPTGRYRIRPRSKLIDPQWTNPRTGEFFAANDPRNPIGEFWLGLEGTEERTRDIVGYGVHGTIEPESIGMQRSMGCIRMLPQDIELIYQVLMEDVSTVEIR